ncbi:pyruvate flavodoxin/ferredoxin oxidoreductase-like protein [Plesiocystis pacifica SIR-1]|uniref:Pyruvate flavodoxin/ferredoxin oxidoreductase-like protein n=1 Tax=Plesiocystis pacifica SIR-1 TaxID=391625 RepID=A6GEI0_9BACT|nr:2-oxoacid:acceptor oxidoreductase subunit alpha [Plesiocystis pacifica]EDM75752.1 pyruvate flavodoxin/ferredoxin oxidoreductase-like protein [Plesiocystis pacifica SIR-1]
MDTFPKAQEREALESVVIRFAGDSGDGMQLTGSQFTNTTALMGNDLATFPDFPAEIRAPAGTTYGVSGFQIHFAAHDIMTPGDEPDVLVAMNPAALKTNIGDLKERGLLIVNSGAFIKGNLKKAGYAENPLEDEAFLSQYRVIKLDIQAMTLAAVAEFELGTKNALRSKNMWTLGLVLWLFGRETKHTVAWLEQKFAKKPDIAKANVAALKAGHAYGETAELPSGIGAYEVPKAKLPAGTYRNITGNDALAWGLTAASKLSGLKLVLGSYPITPASSVLHALAKLKHFGVTTFQAEDEIAAVCAAVGASWGGALGITTTSGPGVALKGEAIGLAIMLELPLIVCDIQRGGPSTGMPTKTEQSDLLQAVYGRNGDAPMPVLAACTPGDCFFMAIEAARISVKYMTPVMLLTDGYLANGAEPWKIPAMADLEPFPVSFPTERPEGFHPYLRDPETLARPWAIPGTPGLEHRIGGLEKDFDSGNISYDPDNHHKMTKTRAAKVAGIAKDIPAAAPEVGETSGDLLVIGWGSTYGAITQAVRRARAAGKKVSQVHLRYINPLPPGLGELIAGFDKVIVPEMNNGMLSKILRSEFLVDAVGINKISGQPFKVSEIQKAIEENLA